MNLHFPCMHSALMCVCVCVCERGDVSARVSSDPTQKEPPRIGMKELHSAAVVVIT